MARLILMRHGESEWNRANLFTGWVDVPLSLLGVEQALKAGEQIKDEPIDVIFTSKLVRALATALIAMTTHHTGKIPIVCNISATKQEEEWSAIHNQAALEMTIPVIQAMELNERRYGDLQGLDKQETIDKYGAEQVLLWRRSFHERPPNGESLAMTAARTIPYFEAQIKPLLEKGKNVLVSAHGNSLRSIIMVLDHLNEKEVVNLELPTGGPILYDYNNGRFTKRV